MFAPVATTQVAPLQHSLLSHGLLDTGRASNTKLVRICGTLYPDEY